MSEDPADYSGSSSRRSREPFSLRARTNSFVYALRGVRALFRAEHNCWIHLSVAAVVCVAGWWFAIGRLEWALVVFAIGFVLGAEALNTALETLADAVKPERDPLVGRAKDLSAAAVLLASAAAAVIGVIVFGPRVWALLAPHLHSSP